MKVEVLIFVISVSLMAYFLFELFSGISNQAGIKSLISSIFMLLLLVSSASLIVSHWKEKKESRM
ncbi:hypothetical protein [Anaerobacillus sp. 1_MG-2023]|uniref:hypothetical protein n=1 Tax=Bacillales TaxID=1385 RepID=UPI0026E34123|nr:hypothetical protein [Anaerobacillus sp. 1_MG-2023]MDO6656960.1 hypothetical protein [Anaerobacillus sp. 1_MG-2023]